MRPIPSKILSQSITILSPASLDVWKHVTYETLSQAKVHIQPTNEIRKSKENTDVVLRSLLFVDARLSTPFIDWAGLIASAEEVDGELRVVCDGHEYTVMSVDSVPNDHGQLHHYEVGLV